MIITEKAAFELRINIPYLDKLGVWGSIVILLAANHDVLTLYWIIQQKHNHVFTIPIIPPH